MARIKHARPALVIAVLALIAALAGTALAGSEPEANTAGAAQKAKKALKKSKKALKKANANATLLDELCGPGASAAGSETCTAPQGPKGDTGSAGATGATGATGAPATERRAVIDADSTGASVVRGNATGADRIGEGEFFVSFAADIRPCVYVATLGDNGAGLGTEGEISVEQRSGGNATDVLVRTYDSAGAPEDPAATDGFHIAVFC